MKPDVDPGAARGLHLWRLELDPPEGYLRRLAALLSPDESERAGRFKFERDRRRFTAARGQLRQVLGWWTGLAPQTVHFEYGPYGKPRLAGANTTPHFNLAHSDELALVALSPLSPVGVDLEYHRLHLDLDGIARRFFAPGEVARWAALPEAERPAAFFRCWTRKEAYLKAHGAGLSVALDQFEVSFGQGEPPRLLWAAGGVEQHWALADIGVPEGYTAAVAFVAQDSPSPIIDHGKWAGADN